MHGPCQGMQTTARCLASFFIPATVPPALKKKTSRYWIPISFLSFSCWKLVTMIQGNHCTQRISFRRVLCWTLPNPMLGSSFIHGLRPVISRQRNPSTTFMPFSSKTALDPLSFPATGFEVIDSSKLVEEELLPGYDPERYYPAHIGEGFNQRYQIIGKLGFGVTSTVWLARDLL